MTSTSPEPSTTALDASHRRYLIRDQCIGAMIVNVLINAGIAWLMFRSAAVVPLWGQQSIASDTIGTTFFLPFFTCLIVTPLTHSAVRTGRLARPGFRRASHAWLHRLPAGTLLRGVVLGLVGMVMAAPVSLWALVWPLSVPVSVSVASVVMPCRPWPASRRPSTTCAPT